MDRFMVSPTQAQDSSAGLQIRQELLLVVLVVVPLLQELKAQHSLLLMSLTLLPVRRKLLQKCESRGR
jgi:hypothetical protein